MKNKHLIIIIIFLSVLTIISSLKKKTAPFFSDEKEKISVKNAKSSELTELDLEEYVVGVVAGEMPASFKEEALKAQAIASRTYAMFKKNNSKGSYDVLTDISNQVYINDEEMKEKWGRDYEKYKSKIENCVSDTKGLVMKYDGKIISSYYFAMSNGKTEDAELVFGAKEDYLKSVDSSWDQNVKNFSVVKSLSKREFCSKLNINCNEIMIKNILRTDSGRVSTITINDVVFSGIDIRKKLDLRSSDFEIVINDTVDITTKGYGHGVGMSQYGANEMAKDGKNYQDILNYYYQNITIEKINV